MGVLGGGARNAPGCDLHGAARGHLESSPCMKNDSSIIILMQKILGIIFIVAGVMSKYY